MSQNKRGRITKGQYLGLSSDFHGYTHIIKSTQYKHLYTHLHTYTCAHMCSEPDTHTHTEREKERERPEGGNDRVETQEAH